MKKIIFFLFALLFTAGANIAKADPISDVSQLSNSKAYTINTARGAWTLSKDGSNIVSTKKSGAPENNDAADPSDEAQQFAIYQSNGFYYIYNLKAEKFMVLDDGNQKVSEYVTTPFVFSASNNNSYPLSASTWDLNNMVNNNNGGGIVINSWRYFDDGNRLAIAEARDLTSDETTSISNAVNGSPLNSNKAFMVTANRGTWCANAAGTSLATTMVNTNPDTGYDQFALVIFDNKIFIYNVGTQKFIRKDGSLIEGCAGDPIAIRLSGNATRPYMFYFPDGGIYFNMQGDALSYAMDTYRNADDGNMQSISQVDVDPYSAASTQYNRTMSVTYNVMYEGVQVGTETVTQRLGVEPSAPSTPSRGFNCTYNVSLIQSGTTTVTATVVLPFTVSPDYVGATWYNMYIRQSDRWVPYSESSEPYMPYAATDEDKETKELQWAFIGNPFTTGIKVINRAAGRGKSLTKDGSNAVMRDGDTYWDMFGRKGGFLLREHGTENNYINQNGGSTGKFQFWNSGYAKGDDGSTMWVAEAPVTTTTITYNVKYNDNTVATTTATAVVDDPTPLTKIPAAIVRDYVTLEGDDTHNVVANDVIDLTATWDGPFDLSTSFAEAHWYDMAMRSNWYVTSDRTDDNGALLTVEANAIGLGEDAYQWAFVGDPYHIQLYNKAEGDSKVFNATDVETNQGIPTFSAGPYYWKIVESTSGISNAFCLNVAGTNLYINQYGGPGGSLKFWNSGNNISDGGSAFTVFEVPTDYSEFVASEISPYFENTAQYFVLNDAAKTAIGYDPSYKTVCPFNTYKSMKETLLAKLADDDNFVYPETGYYRFESKYYPGYYMAYRDNSGNPALGAFTDDTTPSSFIKLTKTGDKTYNVSAVGLYATAPVISTPIGIEDAVSPVEFTVSRGDYGFGSFTTGEGYGAIHCAASKYCVGWLYDSPASYWSLTDATSFNITIGSAGYSTLWVPFAVTIPDGITAYRGSVVDNHLHLEEITGGTLPANTAVVLNGDAGTYTFNITNDVDPIADNDLLGSKGNVTGGDGIYVLSTLGGDSPIGFYPLNSGVTIPANKAYLNDAAGVKGFTFLFGDTEDGIESIENGQLTIDNAIYNLSGQRLSKAQKGINIINGKKILK